MGKIVSFSNQKGGVGKTTSCVNIAAQIANKGKKVLCEKESFSTICLQRKPNSSLSSPLSNFLNNYSMVLDVCR
jgi:chromosome partitioning protein